jgi:hypothetical protein
MAILTVGFKAGAYTSMDPITLYVPRPIRRIVAAFYMVAAGPVPVPLTPVVTANADYEVQIASPTSIKIYKAAGLTDVIVFLFVETELEYLSKNYIPP